MKNYLAIIILLIGLCSCKQVSKKTISETGNKTTLTTNEFDPFSKLTDYNKRIKQQKLNIQYVFVVDYAKHSGKKRLYLLDILHHKIVRKMMVAHGSKSETKTGYATDFSNIVGSNKSSLGYCVVNQRAYSKWGIHIKYWLDGLDTTNSNMRKRVMVLHSYVFVPKYETYPLPIVASLGCVMISENDMTFLDKLIKKQHNKKILMYIRA